MFKRIITLVIAPLALTLSLTACGGGGASSSVASIVGAFVLATDFSTGAFGVIDPATRAATTNAGSVHSDATARLYGGLIYVLNRLGADNIQVIDPNNSYSTVRQFSVGSGANPFDIAFVSATKAYVSRYAQSDLWIIDPSTGTQSGSIDLTPYGDADGVPEMAGMVISDGKLFVAVQSLNRNAFFATTGNSQVVVIDTATDSVIGSLAMPFQNPVGDFAELSDGTFAIACAGVYGANDGGVVILDTARSSLSASSVTETSLGGDLNALVMTSPSSGFAVVNDASFNTSLVKFSAGAVTTLYNPGGFSLAGIALTGSELWIADQTFSNPGVRIFDADSGAELTTAPISVGLPPTEILFL